MVLDILFSMNRHTDNQAPPPSTTIRHAPPCPNQSLSGGNSLVAVALALSFMLWSTALSRSSMLPLSAEFMLGPPFLFPFPACMVATHDIMPLYNVHGRYLTLLQ